VSALKYRAAIVLLAAAAFSGAAVAHVVSPPEPSTAGSESAELLGVVLPLAIAAALYLVGWLRLHRRAEPVGERWWRAGAFAAGWIALVAALLSPIDRWSAQLFSIHMIQHEMLMLIAAPLLVLGRPLPVFLWAFGMRGRAAIARATRFGPLQSVWRTLLRPLNAWALHALALWIWHAPRAFEAALVNQTVHDLQHFTFLVTALLFWSALLHARGRENQGTAVLYLFTTTVHTSVLGALITFGAEPWYPAYLDTAPLAGLSALEDQQLGGLIMWVPGSLVYIGIGLTLLARWIGAPQRMENPPRPP
jgi:putative membrane protein